MEPPADKSSDSAPEKAPRRRFSLRKIAWIFLGLSGGFLLAITAAYLFRVPLTNTLLRTLVPDYAIHLDHWKLTSFGHLEVTGLSVRARDRKDHLLTLEKALIEWNWRDLRQKKIEKVQLHGLALQFTEKTLPPPSSSATSTSSKAPPAWKLDRLTIRSSQITLDLPPPLRLHAEFSLEGTSFDLATEPYIHPTPIALAIDSLQVTHRKIPVPPLVALQGAQAHFFVSANGRSGRVTELTVPQMALHINGENFPSETLSSPDSAEPSEESKAFYDWNIDTYIIAQGEFTVEESANYPLPLPPTKSQFTARGKDLRIHPELSSSPALHQLILENAVVGKATDSTPPLFQSPRIALELIPDELIERGSIASLHIASPQWHLSPKNLEPLITPAQAPPSSTDRKPSQKHQTKPQKTFSIQSLQVEEGPLQVTGFDEKVPQISAQMAISTHPREGQLPLYEMQWTNIFLVQPGQKRSFGKAGKLILKASPEDLQKKSRVETILIDGLDLTVSDQITQWLAPEEGEAPAAQSNPEPPPQKESTATTPPLASWQIGRFQVIDSRFTLINLFPGMPDLRFTLNLSEEDIAFSQIDAELEEERRRIEISNLIIPSRYSAFIPVLEMPNIFIEFTLAGILRKEIEKVEILNPKLFVGEHLFWYIDRYRQESKAKKPKAKSSLPREIAAYSPPPSPAPQEIAVPSPPAWVPKEIYAYHGKLIIAPQGNTLGLVPFPFNAQVITTEKGQEYSIEVPEGDFVFPEFKLEFLDLTGLIQFNLPPKEGKNNLVPTLLAKQALFRQFQADNVYLTMTFDKRGIYGQFGGEAYEGYVEGGFNIYIQNVLAWDSWVAGSALDMKAITAVLAPESFSMTGAVDLTLVGKGPDLNEFVEKGPDLEAIEKSSFEGNFTSKEPGQFDITYLESLLDSIPDTWGSLQTDLTTIGIETLRQFSYEKAESSFFFQQRDGKFSLDLEGPHGSRRFEINLYDRRQRTLNNGGAAPSNSMTESHG